MLALLTPLLLAATPRAGYITGMVSAVCELGWDVGMERTAISVAAGVALAGGAVIAWSRRQQRVVARAAVHAPVDPQGTYRQTSGVPERRRRLVVAASLGGCAVACGLWYIHDATALAARENRAHRDVTTVTRTNDDGHQIFVALDPSIGIPVLDTSVYVVGQPVSVLDTPDGDRLWLRPVGEPEDATFPLSYAVGLAALAIVVVAGMIEQSRAYERLTRATSGVPLLMTIKAEHRAVISATPSKAELASMLLNQPQSNRQTLADQSTTSEPNQQKPSTAQVPRPVPAILVGDLSMDAWAALIHDGVLLLPRSRPARPARA